MNVRYSTKEHSKKQWKKFFIVKKLHKIMGRELGFMERLRFVLFGEF